MVIRDDMTHLLPIHPVHPGTPRLKARDPFPPWSKTTLVAIGAVGVGVPVLWTLLVLNGLSVVALMLFGVPAVGVPLITLALGLGTAVRLARTPPERRPRGLAVSLVALLLALLELGLPAWWVFLLQNRDALSGC